MKQILGILLFTFITAYSQQDTSLILSEIMFTPQSGNNEFIELYNTSTETINLNGLKIKYYTASADIIIDAGWGMILPPLSYAVILEGDYDFASGIYNIIIPPGALKLKISDNSFGATGMANTADRNVKVLNSASTILDQRTYTADNTPGYSEEKINQDYDSLNINWNNSAIFNGTPGSRNSAASLDNDLCIKGLSSIPLHPVWGEEVQIIAVILNKGSFPAGTFNITFYNDTDYDSIPSLNEMLSSEDLFNLNPGDSVTSEAVIISAEQSRYNIIAKITYSPDEDTLNNSLCLYISINNTAVSNDLIFNEIMFAPIGGMPEWVELYNKSGTHVNLKDRRISDNTSSVFITREDLILPADSFAVLSKDSSILNFFEIPSALFVLNLPSLNNSGDDLVIKNASGTVTDSLSYLPEWGGSNGRSLERENYEDGTNDPDNWGSSVALMKGSPGRINSLTPKSYDLTIISLITEPAYGIIGENINIVCCIKNMGLFSSAAYTLDLFYDINKDSAAAEEEIISAYSGLSLMPGDSIVVNTAFSSYSTGLNHLIALIEASPDEDLTNNTAYGLFTGVQINEGRNDLVINEIIFTPQPPEPEWIEIFNRSDKAIDIKNYSLADNGDTVNTTGLSKIILPGEYLIIASDSIILDLYTICSHLLIADIPPLNNSGDKVMLLDSLTRVIDSLLYTEEWGIRGRSIERINAEMLSDDPANWKANCGRNNGSPGNINSVTQKEYDIELTQVFTNPPFPLKGDNASVSVKIRNKGSSISAFNIKMYSDKGLDSIPDDLLETISGLSLDGNDSAVYSFNYIIKYIQEPAGYSFYAESSNDQDTSNNNLHAVIASGSPPGSLVINEILPDPDIDNSEFIELYNFSSDTLNIAGWKIENEKGDSSILSDTLFFIPPSVYYLIAADSIIINKYNLADYPFLYILNSSLRLLNEGGVIVLKDIRGNVIDSLAYSDKWYNQYHPVTKNISLERINPQINTNQKSNWGSSKSTEGATPGEENSLYCINPFTASDISVSPNPFSPDNDGFEDNCIINYKLLQPALSVRVKIFDSKGRLVRILNDSYPGGRSGSIVFNGFDDNSHALKIGIYIILIEALYENSETGMLKAIVVIARKLN